MPSAPLAGLALRAGEIDRDDRRARRQFDLEERLRAIAHLEPHFGQRAAFAGDQRRGRGAIGRGREHAGIGKSLDLEAPAVGAAVPDGR